jgi:hypothetical protein
VVTLQYLLSNQIYSQKLLTNTSEKGNLERKASSGGQDGREQTDK